MGFQHKDCHEKAHTHNPIWQERMEGDCMLLHFYACLNPSRELLPEELSWFREWSAYHGVVVNIYDRESYDELLDTLRRTSESVVASAHKYGGLICAVDEGMHYFCVLFTKGEGESVL